MGLNRPPSIATEVSFDFLDVRFVRTSLSCERLSPELSFLWLSFSMLEAFCWLFAYLGLVYFGLLWTCPSAFLPFHSDCSLEVAAVSPQTSSHTVAKIPSLSSRFCAQAQDGPPSENNKMKSVQSDMHT